MSLLAFAHLELPLIQSTGRVLASIVCAVLAALVVGCVQAGTRPIPTADYVETHDHTPRYLAAAIDGRGEVYVGTSEDGSAGPVFSVGFLSVPNWRPELAGDPDRLARLGAVAREVFNGQVDVDVLPPGPIQLDGVAEPCRAVFIVRERWAVDRAVYELALGYIRVP